MYKYIKFLDDIKAGDIIIHISHIDLDGYGASYIVKSLIIEGVLCQFNTNYGEIIQTLKRLGINEKMKVLITDLNLSLDEAEYLDTLTKNWLVVDHHGTGKSTQKAYPDNYYLDTERCGTKLIYDLINCTKFNNTDKYYKDMTDMVNTYDLWKKNENPKYFKIGMLISHYIKTMPFIDNTLIHKYISFLFDNIVLNTLMSNVNATESFYQTNFDAFLDREFGDYLYVHDKDLPTNIKCAYLHESVIEKYITHETNEYVIFENISTSITQYVFDKLFDQDEYKNKVLINLNSKGHLSFRSINDKAVTLAVKCISAGRKGGGHPNAAGGAVDFNPEQSFVQTLVRTLAE